jgi:uncharacterized membrane protein SirB2
MDINSTLRNLGIGLVLLGIILLAGFGLYHLLTALLSTELNWISISLTAIILGIILALISLLKEKMEKKDKETERKY